MEAITGVIPALRQSKYCLACGRGLKGRTDKKFCDDSCRSNYNNRLNSDASSVMRKINNRLRKNRRILEEILLPVPAGEQSFQMVPELSLKEKGFNFDYFTHTFVNKEGRIYHFCYEYGYLPLQPNRYLVVKWREVANEKKP